MPNIIAQYHYYLRIILARKRLFLAISLSIMTIGVIIAYKMPKIYKAESTVFLDQNVITDLVKGIAVTPSVEGKIKMLSVTLLSRGMLLKVIDEIDKDMHLKTDIQQEQYLDDLVKRIQVSFNEKERVFRIALRDKSPIFARDFVNALTRKYIEDNTSSKREESLDATKFLGEQIESFKKRIDAAELAIDKFKSEKGFILASDDVFLRGEIAGAERKLEELIIKRSQLESKKRLLFEFGPESTGSSKLAEAERRLADLESRYTDSNPKVGNARSEVARLKSGKSTSHFSSRLDSTTMASAQMLQVEIDSYKEMEAHQSKIISESEKLLREMPAVKAELAELVRKKDNESVVYQQLVSRYGQSEVSKQMELQDKSVTFRIMDPAVTPLAPISPNRLAIILGSVVAGIGLAIGLIVMLEIIKGGVTSPADLKHFDIPVLAVIPHVTNLPIDTERRRQDRLIFGFAAGYFVLILLFATADALRLGEYSSSVKALVGTKISHFIEHN